MSDLKQKINEASFKNHPRDDTFSDDHIRETFCEGAKFGLELVLDILEGDDAHDHYCECEHLGPLDWASFLREKLKELE